MDSLVQALFAVKSGFSLNQAADMNGIPRTTLKRKIRENKPILKSHEQPPDTIPSELWTDLMEWLEEFRKDCERKRLLNASNSACDTSNADAELQTCL